SVPTEQIMNGVGGLLLTGGLDVDPSHYGATPDPGAGIKTNLRTTRLPG
ncbi:MAG: gamma-glutamyl-gamma-aminobutyrate hydrolase family protein, partial [Crocinitomicaceae bacterium]|nr:gamma-glutamyl-gamma-aminobutyrate hydrolase family protein [Crocinitomicaceae bacterium]